jgi:hypothetical protein
MDELDRERARLNKIRLKKLREKQPAVLRRKAEREKEREASKEWSDLHSKTCLAKWDEEKEPPLYEALADAFDLASDSFAVIRPRLTIHVRHAVAELEANRICPWHSLEERQALQPKLDRAREILKTLEPEPPRLCASCGKPFVPGRRDAVTCSSACRQREYRKRVTDKAAREAYP